MIANLALCYAVERLGLPIEFDGELTVGRGLQDGFYRRCYERTIAAGKYSHDGLLYCILRVKDAIGWRPFETVMRRLREKRPEKEPRGALFDRWMRMLSEEGHRDVRSTFLGGEYEFILALKEF
jgi:hypothetical protein